MEKEKYTDEQINAFLDTLDIRLYECQREAFKRIVNREGPLYYIPTRHNRMSLMLEMLNRFYDVMEGDGIHD